MDNILAGKYELLKSSIFSCIYGGGDGRKDPLITYGFPILIYGVLVLCFMPIFALRDTLKIPLVSVIILVCLGLPFIYVSMKFIMFIVYSNIQGEKIKHLHFLLANVEELELVIGGILTYDYSKGSIDSYLSLLEDFKQKVLVVKDVGNLILLNSHPNKIEAYFSHPIDLGPVHSVYLDWVVYTENVVSAALKSNLTLMRKKIVEYTASVISLEAAESGLAGARDAQVVRLEELSRSFERVRIPTSVIQG